MELARNEVEVLRRAGHEVRVGECWQGLGSGLGLSFNSCFPANNSVETVAFSKTSKSLNMDGCNPHALAIVLLLTISNCYTFNSSSLPADHFCG